MHFSLTVFHAVFHKNLKQIPCWMMYGEDHVRVRKHFKDAICQSGYPTNYFVGCIYITVSVQISKVLLKLKLLTAPTYCSLCHICVWTTSARAFGLLLRSSAQDQARQQQNP